MSLLSQKIRIEWKSSDAKRDFGLKTPDDVVRFDDLCYGPYGKENMLDVYRPKNQTGCLPVIINVHGGGWVYGDKELYQFYGMSLAQRGFAVLNFTYRLAPENKYPAPLEDLNNVVIWMFEHASEYGLDVKNVFTVGDSAGGHLSSFYAAICTNPEFASRFSFRVPNGFVPNAIALNCGVYAPLGEDGKGENALMEDFLPGKGTKEETEEINVLKHITDDYPPVFLMSAPGDFCLIHTDGMEKVLKEKKVPYLFRLYGNKKKPLYHVFHVTIQEPMGQKCNDDECAFFRSYMK